MIQKATTGKRIFLFILFTILGAGAQSQSTVSIRLSSATGEGAYVSDFYPVGNFPNFSDLTGVAWTQTSTAYVGRSYFKYDLSGIPANAVVISAYLSLYANPTPVQPAHSTLSGANNAWIEKVTDPWDDNTITWTNKPATTAAGQIPLAASVSPQDDYLNINVTQLVNQMVSNPAANHGFMLRLQTELNYRSLNFASIACTDTSKQPLLVITYATNLSCVDLKLDATTGEGAYVSDFYPTGNFPGYSDLTGISWTELGTPYVGRSYFKFDLSAIPANAVVASAYLSLFANPSPTQPAHSTLGGANNGLLQVVTDPWSGNTITWTNKPGTTAAGEVPLAASLTPQDDYLNMDVTQITAQMVNNPSTNHGFMLRLETETNYRSLNFASISCTDTTKKPRLVICYSITTGQGELGEVSPFMHVYPNPSEGSVTISFDRLVTDCTVELFNLLGEVVFSETFSGTKLQINPSLSAGIYVLKCADSRGSRTEKIVVR